ncbi:MAG: PTS sugar transporter subunit IIC [Alphaproteobacteria bacterium]|nr:PTS sugar transporter subunit IIC [Alphaproteobacteria bacterium]
MRDFVNKKLIPAVMIVVNTKAIISIKNGMMVVMPFTIIGSVFLLLANPPIKPLAESINNAGLTPFLNQAFNASFGIMAFFAVMGIASSYVKESGFDGQPAGMIALSGFILLMLPEVMTVDGVVIGNVINREWVGGKGMVLAIIVGLITGAVYSWFLKKDIRIKLPESVPPAVASSFTALIPAAVIISFFTFIYAICLVAGSSSAFDLIYIAIQIPLQNMTDSFGGVLLMGFLIPFLWFFGIHGSSIVSGVLSPVLVANALINQSIIDSGLPLTIANGGRIVTQQFLDQFMTTTGAGMTMGVAIFMVAFARAQEYKTLGRLSIGPAFFNINEPILFATPIVMNPFMAIPFFLTPMLSGTITYFALKTGLVPLFSGVLVPWTTPPIISGLLVGGWQAAILQFVVLAMSFFMYYPFISKMDSMAYQTEQESNTEEK